METLIRYMIVSLKGDPLSPMLFNTLWEAIDGADNKYGSGFNIVEVEVKVLNVFNKDTIL